MPNGRSLHIVHVIYSGLGGHSAVMFALLEAGFMDRAVHHVVLAGIEPPPRDYTDRLDGLNIGWTHVSKQEGRAHLDFYRRLRRALFTPDTDVIYLHGVAAVPAVAMMLGRRRKGPKIVLRETEPTQVKTRRVWAMLALAHICTDAVVHLTKEAAADAHAKLGILHRKNKVHVISNGLDTEFFSPATADHNDSVLRIGMQSRLQPTKDHLTLIEAFARLRAASSERQLELHIAGDGPTRPTIEARITDLGLEDAVLLHGMLDRDEVRDFLRELAIYVHSSFGETQSNAILQAMATGLPVVASDVPGISNMIRPGLGLLHRSADVEDLTRRIEELVDDPTLAARLGHAARAQAVSAYGAKASARAWEALITTLCEVPA